MLIKNEAHMNGGDNSWRAIDKSVQPFSPDMYRLLKRIFNQIVLSRFLYISSFQLRSLNDISIKFAEIRFSTHFMMVNKVFAVICCKLMSITSIVQS